MQKNKQGTMFVTASKDNSAKLFDVDDLSVHKVYMTERPVNSASLSPIYDHVIKSLLIVIIISYTDTSNYFFIITGCIGWWSRSYGCNNNSCTSREI